MIKVECDGCKAPYQVDERRIPASGLKMRCPRCGKSFVVQQAAAAGGAAMEVDEVDLPAKPDAHAGLGGASAATRASPSSPSRGGGGSLELDLPALGDAALPATPGARAPATSGLPETTGGAALPATKPAGGGSFGARMKAAAKLGARGDLELDLPADLPAPGERASFDRGRSGDLPVAAAALPSAAPGGFGELPLSVDPALPSPSASGAGPGHLPVATGTHLPTSAGLSGPTSTQLRSLAGEFGSVGPLEIEFDAPHHEPEPLSFETRARAAGPIELPSDLEFDPFSAPSAPTRPRGSDLAEVGISPNFTPVPPKPDASLTGFESPGGLEVGGAQAGSSGDDDWLRLGSLPAPPPTPDLGQPGVRAGEQPASFGPPALDMGALVPSTRDAHDAHDDERLAERAPPLPRGTMSSNSDEIGEELELAPMPGFDGSNLGAGVVAPSPPIARETGPRPDVVSESTEARIVAGRKRSRIVAAVLAVLVVGGSALALVPDVGPFGYFAIRDRARAGADAAELEAIRGRAQRELADDTFAGARAAQDLARAATSSRPRYRPMTAYAAFLTYASELRFGRRPQDEAAAGVLVERLAGENGDDGRLARAAQKAVAGELAPARDAAAQVAERRAADLDVLLLVAEIDLALKANDRALASFQRALAATPGKDAPEAARALFGVARSRLALNDAKGAEQAARDTIKLSPKHAGARTLLASIAAKDPVREAEARKLLDEVTGDTETTKRASARELVAALSLLGRLHLSKSRLTAADQAFNKALKLDPRGIDALVGQGELHFMAGRFSEAAARFDAAMNADADSAAAKIGAVKAHLALERVAKARELVKKLREARPKDPAVLYWAGRAEQAGGNRKDAEAAYEAAISAGGTNPDVTLAYVALANLLASQGRTDDAQKKLAEAEQKFGDAASLLRAKGEIELAAGRYEEARKHFEAALAKEDDLGTRFKLGVSQRLSRAFDEASVTFDQVSSVDKDYPGLALERGLLFEQTGNPDRALEMYADALRKAPNDVDLKLRIGSTQVTGGHADQAEPILREVVKARPNSAEANHYLGRALLVRGSNLAEAMRFLERAAELDPNKAEYHLYVGWGANESGQPGKAEASLKKALELDRELGDAYWQRGVLLQKQGATRDALVDLKLALEKRPSRHEAYATMAICYQDQSQWAPAEEAWRKAIAANGAVPEWRYRLGKLYAQRGNRAGAQTELEQAVKLLETQSRGSPGWTHDAHFLLAEGFKISDRERAVRHYRKFLELAPRDHAYRGEAEKAIETLGGKR